MSRNHQAAVTRVLTTAWFFLCFTASAIRTSFAFTSVSPLSSPGLRRCSLNQLQAGPGPTLFGSQGSRSPLINWGALELNVPLQMGNLAKNPHPFGQIPALTDDEDVLVFESGAILQYLYAHSAVRLSDSQARQAAVLSWIVWANASLDPICFLSNDGRVYDTGLRKPNRRIDTLDRLLSTHPFLIQDGGFSLADVAVASYLLYVIQFFPDVDLTRWPHLLRYMRACASREAYGKAFGGKVQNFVISTLEAMMTPEKDTDEDYDDDNGKEDNTKKKFMGIF